MSVIVEPATVGGWRILLSGFPVTGLHDSRQSATEEAERLARRYQLDLVVRTEDGGEIRRTEHLQVNQW